MKTTRFNPTGERVQHAASYFKKLFIVMSSAMLLLTPASCAFNKMTLSSPETAEVSTGTMTAGSSETNATTATSKAETTSSAPTKASSTQSETKATTQTTAQPSQTTEPAEPTGDIGYRVEMISLVAGISSYAKSIKKNFLVVPQNGEDIIDVDSSSRQRYFSVIDGIGREDFLYGSSRDNVKTSSSERNAILSYLNVFRSAGKTVMVTDYCSTPEYMLDSYDTNAGYGFISFAADDRELRTIPAYPLPVYRENANNVSRLSEAENFLYLINPDNFSSKDAFISAVAESSHDLVILDLFFDGTPLAPADLAKVKLKKNGGSRLVICYMSVGEAEDYRYYWKNAWESSPPAWLEHENPDWDGCYIVNYWDPEWQQILFGNDKSYTKRILDAGFDGIYLDIIDAYEYYESR